MPRKLLTKTSAIFLLSSRETDENHSVNPSSYIGVVLQEITRIVKESISYNRGKEQTPVGWGATPRMTFM